MRLLTNSITEEIHLHTADIPKRIIKYDVTPATRTQYTSGHHAVQVGVHVGLQKSPPGPRLSSGSQVIHVQLQGHHFAPSLSEGGYCK